MNSKDLNYIKKITHRIFFGIYSNIRIENKKTFGKT